MSRRLARALPSPAAGRDVSTVLRVRVRSTGAHWAQVRARRAASSERVHSRHRPRPLLGVRAALRSTRVASRQPARHPLETRVATGGMSGTSSPQQARWSGRPVYPRRILVMSLPVGFFVSASKLSRNFFLHSFCTTTAMSPLSLLKTVL